MKKTVTIKFDWLKKPNKNVQDIMSFNVTLTDFKIFNLNSTFEYSV